MQVSVPIPLDADGFIRRECPNCKQEFKWHYGPTGDRPSDFNDPPVYHCPLCGVVSEPSEFMTAEQAKFVTAYAMRPAMEELEAEMKKSGFGFKIDSVDAPDAIVEVTDMTIIAPPCHEWEPVKVPDESAAPYHCLLCGQPFTV